MRFFTNFAMYRTISARALSMIISKSKSNSPSLRSNYFLDEGSSEVSRCVPTSQACKAALTKSGGKVELGTVDLANMNYMCYALTAQGWKMALRNLHELLGEMFN
ncbi:hypothetical protein B0F90DRAFT_1217440 [Multifurca ochricompacta]|uniref:Uncharacterized protein n=1 Tax=Multifurca ochricompacta TaxID=376703 RepID=A0AAD4LYC8_9AGAM|nr:hypothetical protein B0F90DRAFT_1217440 [Multifurca ochricompacta]